MRKPRTLSSQATDLNAGLADAWYYLGLAQSKLNLYAEMVTTFSRAIEATPTNSTAYFQRGLAYYHLKQFREAVQDSGPDALVRTGQF